MPNWMEVSRAIENAPDPLLALRKQYLSTMCKYTGRNIIAYYSAFLQKPNLAQTAIDDNDKNAFMQAVCDLDRKKGLDLILHTPGGNIAATESLVFYLKQMFGKYSCLCPSNSYVCRDNDFSFCQRNRYG